MNITITSVKGYSYTGYILANELSPEQRKVLNIPEYNQFYENDYQVEVIGDFVLEWDDDIPMPQIENCLVIGSLNGKTHEAPLYVSKWCDIDNRIETHKTIYGPVPSHYTLDLDLNLINIEEMETEVSERDTGYWAEDLRASQIDRAYDLYRDNF